MLAGVRKAPRQEIAGCWSGLWGFECGGDAVGIGKLATMWGVMAGFDAVGRNCMTAKAAGAVKVARAMAGSRFRRMFLGLVTSGTGRRGCGAVIGGGVDR